MINWKCSNEDFDLILAVALRVEQEMPDYPYKRSTLLMDLQACHGNGCPLHLAQMVHGDLFDLLHDVLGIRRHINRDTGKLEGCFVPRFANLPDGDDEPEPVDAEGRYIHAD